MKKSRNAFTFFELILFMGLLVILVFGVVTTISAHRSVKSENQQLVERLNEAEKTIAKIRPLELDPDRAAKELELKRINAEKLKEWHKARENACREEDQKKKYDVKKLFDIDGYTIYSVNMYGNIHLVSIPSKK